MMCAATLTRKLWYFLFLLCTDIGLSILAFIHCINGRYNRGRQLTSY
jgi:hypothetical protein